MEAMNNYSFQIHRDNRLFHNSVYWRVIAFYILLPLVTAPIILITAYVTLYGPNGPKDISHFKGFTMTSCAEKFVPIAEGIYICIFMDPGKPAPLPSHRALNKGGVVPTMDNIPNTSPYANKNKDLPIKTGIYIHRTNRNGFAGGTVSTGCLLVAPKQWSTFNAKLAGLDSFTVQVTRIGETREIINFYQNTGVYYTIVHR